MLTMEGYAMKKILISTYEEKGRLCLNSDYLNAIVKSGALSYTLPVTHDEHILRAYLQSVDGLVLSGGGDVEPCYYGEERIPECGENEGLRDEMELTLCRLALEMDIPTLGVCRGLQVMNIALGGTLHQHLENTPFHQQHDKAREEVHAVRIEKGTLLHQILQKDETRVNTRHHQGVKRLAEGLLVNGVAEDGLVEAFELPGKQFFLGVQWHPESLFEHYEDARKIFAAFVAAVKERT